MTLPKFITCMDGTSRLGRPKWHLLKVLRVPSTYRGMRIVYKYGDGFHDDFNVSEELQIKYYD